MLQYSNLSNSDYVKNILDFLSKKENNTRNKDLVLKSLAELSDELRKKGQLTDEYKKLMMEEVEKRIVERQ